MIVNDVPFLKYRMANLVQICCLVLCLIGLVASVGAQDITSPTVTILNPENDAVIYNPSADLEFSLDDENPMTVRIYGGRTTSTLQLLQRQEDISPSTIVFPWSTPALEPEPSITRGLWHFDEMAGTTLGDGSENGNTGAFIGEVDPPWIEDGRFGPALDFDGLDDYVVIPDDPTLDIDPTTGAITMEAWVYPDDVGTGTWRTILAKRAMGSGLTNYQLTIHMTTGTLLFYDGGTVYTSDMAIPAGEWSYIAVTWDATDKRMHFYRNGIEEDYIDNVNIGPANDADLHIGVSSQIGVQTFDGVIDEVRISGRALDAAEIAANYTMADGSYYWRVVAEDTAANATSSDIHYFSIATAPDINPPQITLLAPENMSTPGGNQVTFSATATDISPMTIELYADTTADPTYLLHQWDDATGYIDPFEFGIDWNARQLPVLPDYTVGLWHFNENNGLMVYDDSPFGNDGGTSGYPGWESQGRFHSAIDFDGSNDYVTINDDASLDIDSATGEFTLEAWVYPHISGGDQWQGIISKRPLVSGDYNCNYQLSIDGATGNLMYYASGADWSQTYVSDVNIPAGEWSYIALTLKSSEGVLRFYRNGEELDSIEDAVIGKSHQYPLFIGIAGRYLECFDGLIDEVRITKKALPAAAIAKNYVLPDGVYNWKIVATDSNTNQITSETRSFTIEDVTAPDIYLAYPPDAGVFYEPSVELEINLWDENPMDVKIYGGRDADPTNLLYAADSFMGDEIHLEWNSTPLSPVSGETMGLWHFDENNGAATGDAGEAANTGTLMGNPVWTNDGHFGYTLDFDGDDDYVIVPDNPSLDIDSATGALTIEAWIYPENLDNGVTQTILAKRGFGSSLVNYQLSCDAATGALFLYSGNYPTYLSDVIVPENEWSFIAVTLAEGGYAEQLSESIM